MIINIHEYANILQCAIKNRIVRTFVIEQLKNSLTDIGIRSDCTKDIIDIILKIKDSPNFDSEKLFEKVSCFREKWSSHLNKKYFEDYEKIRCEFVDTYVLKEVEKIKKHLGRCLDIGCGRGCLTEYIVSKGFSKSVIGIDEVPFRIEWDERIVSNNLERKGSLKFDHVPVQTFESWLDIRKEFDTIFLFYVLHHSPDYWVVQTLRSIRNNLKKGGIVAILEDSFIEGKPLDDPCEISLKWKRWCENSKMYALSEGYSIQIVLDFVAVQLLAGFKEVSMSCNYKVGAEWEELFRTLGFKILKSINVGFPKNRDIYVPQAVFILQSDYEGQ